MNTIFIWNKLSVLLSVCLYQLIEETEKHEFVSKNYKHRGENMRKELNPIQDGREASKRASPNFYKRWNYPLKLSDFLY